MYQMHLPITKYLFLITARYALQINTSMDTQASSCIIHMND